MITSSKASLSIFSETHRAADVSAVLGLEPTSLAEKGAPKRRGNFVHKQSVWTLDSPRDPDSLELLVQMLRGKGPGLAALRENYEAQITFSAFSDSEQGGLVLSAPLLAGLAELGCDILATTYLEQPEDETPSVTEHVVLPVIPGREVEFEAAFAEAKAIVAASPGFRGLSLSRGIETPNHYLMLIEWDSLDDHEVGFRGSAAYDQWRALLHHFYEPFPEVTHFAGIENLGA